MYCKKCISICPCFCQNSFFFPVIYHSVSRNAIIDYNIAASYSQGFPSDHNRQIPIAVAVHFIIKTRLTCLFILTESLYKKCSIFTQIDTPGSQKQSPRSSVRTFRKSLWLQCKHYRQKQRQEITSLNPQNLIIPIGRPLTIKSNKNQAENQNTDTCQHYFCKRIHTNSFHIVIS